MAMTKEKENGGEKSVKRTKKLINKYRKDRTVRERIQEESGKVKEQRKKNVHASVDRKYGFSVINN